MYLIKALVLFAALTGIGLGILDGHPNDVKLQQSVTQDGHPNGT